MQDVTQDSELLPHPSLATCSSKLQTYSKKPKRTGRATHGWISVTATQEQPDTGLAREQLCKQKPLHRAHRAAQRQPSHPAFAGAPAWLRKGFNTTECSPSHARKTQHPHRGSLQLEEQEVSRARSSLTCLVFKCCNSFPISFP